MITPTRQQNGQDCGKENGAHGHQKPAPVGTLVRSMCQTWSALLAVTTRSDSNAASGCGPVAGFSLSIRAMVVGPKCRPARASVCAIFTLPIVGHSTLSLWTV